MICPHCGETIRQYSVCRRYCAWEDFGFDAEGQTIALSDGAPEEDGDPTVHCGDCLEELDETPEAPTRA